MKDRYAEVSIDISGFSWLKVAQYMTVGWLIFTIVLIYIGYDTFGADPKSLIIENNYTTNLAKECYANGVCIGNTMDGYNWDLLDDLKKVERINNYLLKVISYFIYISFMLIAFFLSAVTGRQNVR